MTIERSIPADIRAAIEREQNDDPILVFLTFTHPSLYEPIRVVSDPENFILDGFTHTGFTFDIQLLSDNDSMPQAKLTIQNVDKLIGQAIMRAVDPPRLEIQVIAASEFDLTVTPRTELATAARMYRAQQLYLTNVEADAFALSGTIRSWDYVQEQWPALRATETRFPSLFW